MDIMEDDYAVGINIAPLVDVCLVLVLVFMVTMPFSAIYGIAVKGDKLTKYGLTVPQHHVVLHLSESGLFIEDEKGQDKKVAYEDYGSVLRQMLQLAVAKDVLVKIDPMVPHGQTVWALDLAKQNGADGISIMEGN